MSGRKKRQERRDALIGARKAYRRQWKLQGAEAGVDGEMVAQKIGVLLPDVDPMVGEIAVTAMYANLNAHPATIAAALARTAPDDDLAVELVSAVMEIMLCQRKGTLIWVEEKVHAILTGIRKVTGKSGFIKFGDKEWPVRALAVGPPQAMTIRVTEGLKVVWAACDSLAGVVVRQSEAIALGNLFIERFGGRIIEDRSGPDVMRRSFIERNMSQKATLRAQAAAALNRRLIERRAEAPADMNHCRVPIAEALPGTLNDGLRIHPEKSPEIVYLVESRINESWVLARAEKAGRDYRTFEGTIWVREDGKPPADGMAPHAGFSDDPATLPVDLARARMEEAAEEASTEPTADEE